MRLKFTVFLIALNLIAFGLISFLNKRSEQTDQSMGGLSGQIGRELIEANRIEIRGQGVDEPRVLELNGSTWSITEPMQWSANYFAVNRILNQLQFLEEEASFSLEEIKKTGQTLADYGLEDPLIELRIAEGADTITLRIGMSTEIGNNVYLLGPNGQDIFVVSRKVIDGLLVDLGDLRTREIFDIPVFEVEALNLQIKSPESAGNGDLKVRLARTTTGWNFEAPLTAKANPTLVSNTINALTAVKVGRFIEPEAIDPILQGLENPFMRITVHGNKRRQTLLIGNQDTSVKEGTMYFAKFEDNPTVFTLIDSKPFEELREAQDALRERNFMSFDPNALTAINISEGDKQIRLQRIETGAWQVIESNSDSDIKPHKADPEIMNMLIEDLSSLRAIGFTKDTPSTADLEYYGFNQPRRTVTLFNGEKEESTLILAHPETENQKLYARNSRNEFIYEVERRTARELLPLNTLHFRNRELDTLPAAAAITSIKLEDLSTQTTIVEYALSEDTPKWEDVLNEIDPEQRDSILILLTSIRSFRLKTYLKDGYSEDGYHADSESTIPWKYRLSASISLPGGEEKRTDSRSYLFTKRLSGTIQIGGSKRHNSLFEIRQNTLDALHQLTDNVIMPPEKTGAPVPQPLPVVTPLTPPTPPTPDTE